MTDLDAIMEVMDAAFDPHWREAWTRRQVEDSLKLPSTYYLLANAAGSPLDEGEAPAGFILARRAADEVELLLIGVRPESRGRGVGRKLIEQFVENAHLNGAAHLFLEMRHNNPAEHLYRMVGFTPIGRRPDYYRTITGGSLDAVTFGMKIQSPD